MQIVDCRQTAPAQQREQVLAACFTMASGSSLLLHAGTDPRKWLRRLAQRYPGAFVWQTLESSGAEWLGIVSRRQSQVSRSGGVHALMAAEHRVVHASMDRLGACCDAEDWRGMTALCDELRRELSQHFAREEQLLFPAVSARLPSQQQLLRNLESEHAESFHTVRAIARLLGEMGRLEAPRELLQRGARTLSQLLYDHSHMEDNFLYMAVEHLLDQDERRQLERQLMRAA